MTDQQQTMAPKHQVPSAAIGHSKPKACRSCGPIASITSSLLTHRMISIYLISLASLAIILATSIQPSDGAALNSAVGKYKSARADRGKFRCSTQYDRRGNFIPVVNRERRSFASS